MSNLKVAAENIKSFAGRLRGLLEAADIIGQVGDLDTAAFEAVNRKEKAEAEASLAEQVLERVRADIKSAEKESALVEHRAQESLTDAFEKSRAIITDANLKAEDIVRAAKNKGAGIREMIEKENVTLISLDEEVQKKRQELLTIQKKIDEARAQIKLFVGE